MVEGDGGWKVEVKGDGTGVETTASYNMCTKMLKMKVKEIIEKGVLKDILELKGVTFLAKVRGTGPDYLDAYRCYLDFLDSEDKQLLRVKFNPTKDLSICRKDGIVTPIII